MRKDESGNECPETLGEYYDLVKAFTPFKTKAQEYLENKIAESTNGRDEIVIASDNQMRAILMPMMLQLVEVK